VEITLIEMAMQYNVYAVHLVMRFCPLTFGRCLYIFWRDILSVGEL
jgi:hypothetical protein